MEKTKKRKIASLCYHHLGGILGELLWKAFVDNRWLVKSPSGREYDITEKGAEELAAIGIDLDVLKNSKRVPVSPCIERFGGGYVEHTGAHLGALLIERFIFLGWLIDIGNKEFEISAAGRAAFARMGIHIQEIN